MLEGKDDDDTPEECETEECETGGQTAVERERLPAELPR